MDPERTTTTPAAKVKETHCKRGHLLSGDNLALWGGKRRCRACQAGYDRARYTPSGQPANRDKTHCPAGHPLTGENVYTPPGGRGRYCRACRAKRHAETYYQMKKALIEMRSGR